MRPLHLSLSGFTAFRQQTELDFTGLDLFAIVAVSYTHLTLPTICSV